MEFRKVALNLMLWCMIALVLGFIIDTVKIDSAFEIGPFRIAFGTGTIITVALIILMTFSLDKFRLDRNKIFSKKIAFDAIILTFVLNLGITLALGLVLLPFSKDAYYGYVMLAAVPCAVSVIAATSMCGNDQGVAVTAIAVTYISGIAITTLVSFLLIGEAVNPMMVASYVLIYVVVPIILSMCIRRVAVSKLAKQIIVNLMLSIIVFFSINKSRGSIFDNVELSIALLAFAAVRIAVLHLASKAYVKKRNIDSSSRMTFFVMGVWKNSGMATAVCISLLGSYPLAAVACVASLVIEDIWFPWVMGRGDAIFEKRRKSTEM